MTGNVKAGRWCAVWLHARSCDSCAFKRGMHASLCCAAVLVAWRSRRSTALRLFAPLIFLLMALVVNLALNANNSLQVRGDEALQQQPQQQQL